MKKESKINPNNSSILSKRSAGEKAVFTVAFLLFVIYALILVLPIVWLFINSFKGGLEYLDNISEAKPFAWPKKFLFDNYGKAFSMFNYGEVTFFGMLGNSIWYVAVVTLEGVFFSACTGYVMAKYKFPGRDIIFSIAIVSMTIPIVGSLGASFRLAYDLGIYNTPLQPILSCAGGFGFNFLILHAFFKSMPWSYSEAVFIDGGNHFTAFFKIMLPMAVAPMLTLGIMSAIGAWNDYSSVILFLPDYPTISAGLYFVKNDLIKQSSPVYFAQLILSMIPIITVFAIFSDKIMTNLSVGGLKG